MNIVLIAVLGMLGLAMGSFINALAWRIHEQARTKKSQKKSSKPGLSILRGRSMCPDCKHTLAWYDLLPILSWLSLLGRCRYCKKPISWQYPLVELITTAFFIASYLFWPLPGEGAYFLVGFGLWALILTLFIALAVYDLRWMLLPNRLMYPLMALAIMFMITTGLITSNWQPVLDGLIGAVVVGGGFWAIYQVSAGKWIGGGDVRLGFVIGLLLGWQKALLAITIAAYLGLGVIIILALLRKYRRRMRLPFGPMLIVGAVTAFLFGSSLINWYIGLIAI